MKLILVRHGETAWNAERRYQGHSDVPLNARGVWQAQRVAEALANQEIDRLFSSDLQRAKATATPIAITHQLPIVVDARWREMNFGEWEGLTHAEIMQTDGAHFEEWAGGETAVYPPNGETLTAMGQRIKRAWQESADSGDSGVETAVLAAHGGSLQLLLCHLLRLPPQSHWQFKLDHASLSYIEIYEAGAMLTSLNDTHHLQDKSGSLRFSVVK